MLKGLRLKALCVALLGGLVAAVGLGATGVGTTDAESRLTTAKTPLFELRLQEMATQFEAVPSPPAHGATAAAGRQMAPAQQHAFAFPSEGLSGCAGSACIASACGGSACVASTCGGSACVTSVCAGSSCNNCNRPVAPGPLVAMGDGAYCPVGDVSKFGAPRIAGFEVVPANLGTEIRWMATGGEVEHYRVYRAGERGHAAVLVAEGPASSDQVIGVIDAAPEAATNAVYTLEVIDAHGRSTRVTWPADGPSTLADAADRVGEATDKGA